MSDSIEFAMQSLEDQEQESEEQSQNPPVNQYQSPSTSKNVYRFNLEEDRWSKHTIDTRPPPIKTKSFGIATWNVDFSRNFPITRLKTSLDHLQSLIEPLLAREPPIPTIILIQELHKSCFTTLLQHPFVRRHYDLTDISPASWQIHYGVVTLAPRSLQVIQAFRTKFKDSRMGRDVLFIDVSFHTDDVQGDPRIIRVANVHLESLRGRGDVVRPRQLRVVAPFLSEPGIHGGIMGGDMNPIGPLDNAVPTKLGFVDAWTLCHDKDVDTATADETAVASPEEVEHRNVEGHTWGYQPPSKYSPCRMDKVLFMGSVTVKEIERVGVGLAVDPAKVQGRSNVWASDHYGLLAKVEII